MQLLLGSALSAATLAARLLPRRPVPSLPALAGNPEVTFVIPNYNGIRHGVLVPCLTSLAAHAPGHRVIVVDDASSDDSVACLQREFPQVRVIPLPRNRGFLHAANTGLRAAATDAVFLANSDLVFLPGFLDPLLHRLRQRGVFAVTPRLLNPDGTLQAGANGIAWRQGHISIWNETQSELPPLTQDPLPTAYAIGAALLCRRAPAAALGWFDPLFAPSNWEDIDLCHAAWRCGWQVVCEPASAVSHRHHATLAQEITAARRAVQEARNEYLFTWKHLDDARLLRDLVRCLPARLAARTRAGDAAAGAGLWQALPRLPAALRARCRIARAATRTAGTVVTAVNEPLLARHADNGQRLRVLFITQEFPWPPASGGRNRNAHLLPRLAREHDILLLAHSAAAAVPPATLPPELVARALPRTYAGDPSIGHLLPHTLAAVTERPMADAIRAALRDFRPDIAVVDSLVVSGYLPLLPDGLPVVYVEHDTDMVRLRHSYLGVPRRAWYADACRLHAWLRTTGDRAAEIVALTATDRRVLRALGIRAPVTLVPTCTDTAVFRPRQPRVYHALPGLVFTGYYAHAPNTDAMRRFAADAWPVLRARHPQLRLRLIGGELPDDLADWARRDGQVDIVGYAADLPAALDGDFVFIAPLISGGGFRGKILDALAMALPVVATPHAAAGLPAPLRDAVTVAAPGAFAAAISRLLTDAGQRAACGERGRAALLRQETWDGAAHRFARILRRAHVRAHWRPVKPL